VTNSSYVQAAKPSFKFNPKVQKLVLSKDLSVSLCENEFKKLFFLIQHNQSNQILLKSESFSLKFYQSYQVISFGYYILLLIKDEYESRLSLYFYDRIKNDLLNLKQRRFDVKLKIHLMNSFEIIFLLNDPVHRYVVLDYDLDVVQLFGQSAYKSKPYYINETSSLIQLTYNRAYLYSYDYQKMLHYVQIMNRFTGLTVGKVFLSKATRFNQIKLDSSNRMLIRFNDSNFRYFDSNGEYLFDLKSKCINEYKNFEFISNYSIYFSNIPNVIRCIA
jgi:hypothetical protein